MGRWEIPNNWEWVKIGEIANIIGGGTPSTRIAQNFSEDMGIAWLTPADLSGYEGTYIKRGKRNLTQAGYDSSSAVLLPPGTVLYTSRAPIGYCVIAKNEIATNQGFKSFVLLGQTVPEYIRYYLVSSKEYAESFASGTTFKELSGSRIKELLVPLPPANEQKRIAKKIKALQSRSAKARNALDAIFSLLEKFRQSVLSSAFRGDLSADWRAQNPGIEPAEKLLERIRKERRKRWEEDELAKMKAKGKTPKDDKWKEKYKEPEPVDTTDLPELPEGWCWASIDQVTFLVTKGASPRWQGFEYCKEGIPFVRSQNIGWGHLLLGNIEYIAEDLNDKQPRSIIQKGDVLLNIVGASIGRAAISKEEISGGNCNQAVAIIRLIPKGLDPTMLMIFIISPDVQKVIHDGKVDVARANYSLDDIKNMAVPVPPENEQKFIEEKLLKLIAFSKVATAKCNDAKDRCNLLDQSILAKAFRGELVPQDPNDEPTSQLLKRIKQEKASLESGKKKGARRGRTAKRL